MNGRASVTARRGMSPSAGLRMLLFLLGLLLLYPLVLEPAAALAARGLLLSEASRTGAQNWGVVLAVAIATAVAARLERRPFGDYGYPRRRVGSPLTEGFVWGVALASLAAVILRVTGSADFEFAARPVAAATVSGAAWWLSRLGFSAIDQFLFRGYLLVTAARGIGFWPAALALTLFFTFEKLLPTQQWQAVPAVAFLAWGLLSALVLKRTGSLWFGTGLGLGLDWGLVFLYGLPMAGTSEHPRGALMNVSAHNTLFTGGAAGIRGSVVMPALIAVAAALVHIRFSAPVHAKVEPLPEVVA